MKENPGSWGAVKAVGNTKVGSAVIDLVPFLGGIKQIRESVSGERLTGEKLTGKKRLVHGLVGVGSLALDFTGVGEVAEGVKGARIVGKSTGFFKGAAGKLGARGATKSAALIEKSAAYMARNPELVKAAENVAEKHLDDGIRYVKTASRKDARDTLKEEASKYLPPEVAGVIVEAGEAKMRGAFLPSVAKQAAAPAISDLSARKAALAAGRVIIKAGTAKPFSMPLSQPTKKRLPTDIEKQEVKEEAEEEEEAAQWEQERASLLRQMTRKQQIESQEGEQEEEKKSLAQKGKLAVVRFLIKRGMARGFIFLLNFIAAACDLSSAGISFIIDIFVYLFSFGWLNLEMIYGRYIA
ncbi:hypothetical protein HZA87_00975, partial [Candidatus Uhrbacteria bacterium]|nr:hypothetical protein [Candidatus Uhrbacteria bacterium]